MSGVLVYRLKPRSPFHFGERGVGIEAAEEVLHSDTLFSALCHAILETRGEAVLQEFLIPFIQGGPPFFLSSGYPYAGEVLLFPKPRLRAVLGDIVEGGVEKSYKKVRFISRNIWLQILRGEAVGIHLKEDNMLQDGALWVSEAERKMLPDSSDKENPRLWSRGVVPRGTVDRVTSASAIYHAGRVVFARGCGLFFLADFRDESLRSLMEEALRYLEDAGLGGERSCGYGQFQWQKPQPFSDLPQGDATEFLTLALYCPREEELRVGVLGERASYELVERRGWIYSFQRSGQRRRSVHMFAEGSVLSRLPSLARSYGCLAKVTPAIDPQAHQVYRYGFAFPVLAAIKEAGHEQG